MYVDHEKRFVFLHIPKTAGMSILNALGTSDRDCDSHGLPDRLDPKLMGYVRFCFVRNPYERVLSAYLYSKRMAEAGRGVKNHFVRRKILKYKYDSFSDFVVYGMTEELVNRNLHFQKQLRWIRIGCPNFIGRLETIDDDIDRVSKLIGQTLVLGRKNASYNREERKARRASGITYRNEYNSKAKRKIHELYADDLRYLNYKFFEH